MDISTLKKKARWVRRQVLEMVVRSGKGHIGGALSCVDILIALYYGKIFDITPANWDQKDRDRFILSKGHACVALYPILADLEFFSVKELQTFGKNNSRLGGHPDRKIPGVEVDTGSLGHGLGIGAGMVLGTVGGEVVVLVGDGECCEGSIWEAAMFVGRKKLERLTVVIDCNRFCSTESLSDSPNTVASRWAAFGWSVDIVDGHSFRSLTKSFSNIVVKKSSPNAIIAVTTKGKGISFMEDKVGWHHGVPTEEELQKAREELPWT